MPLFPTHIHTHSHKKKKKIFYNQVWAVHRVDDFEKMSPLFCLEYPTIDKRNLVAHLVEGRRDNGSFESRQKATHSSGFQFGPYFFSSIWHWRRCHWQYCSLSRDKSCKQVLLRQTSKPLKSIILWEVVAGKLEAGSQCCDGLRQILTKPVLSLSRRLRTVPRSSSSGGHKQPEAQFRWMLSKSVATVQTSLWRVVFFNR